MEQDAFYTKNGSRPVSCRIIAISLLPGYANVRDMRLADAIQDCEPAHVFTDREAAYNAAAAHHEKRGKEALRDAATCEREADRLREQLKKGA